jgi:uncharacterized membrane protein
VQDRQDSAGGERARPERKAQPAGSWWGARLRGYFLAGLLVAAPIGITFYIAWLFISFVDARVKPLIPPRYNPETYLPFSLPGIGLIVVVVFLILMGALAAGVVGRAIERFGRNVLARMPIVRSIYGAVKQVFDTVLAQRSTAFREVVLFEYPRRGIWALGFITGATPGETQRVGGGEEVVNVFMPTTPNPTSGFIFMLPRSELYPLRMTVDEGLKMVVSGGIVTPPDPGPPEGATRPLLRSRRPAGERPPRLAGAQRAGDRVAPEEVEQDPERPAARR